ncbi:MAG: adenylate/guanylate cyclase domain-containing protein, partial [Bacteroidia bacterium]|nr:adenylate/guanylate cyclase domain-containing protein [Bacteroidia bacterium]
VTILFCDIKNFTSFAETLTAEELVSELDVCFKNFDEIITNNGLEKIKTIGDAYMAVGGLPDNNTATAKDVINASLEMQRFIKEHAKSRIEKGLPHFEIRVGINTGPVVTGVVGTKKFQFDIWGEAVNVAARMEQHGEPGKVNVSQSTFDIIKDSYKCISRGKITAKNMGDADMYFVESKLQPVSSS